MLAVVFLGTPGARGSEAAIALLAGLIVAFADRVFPTSPKPPSITIQTEPAVDDVRVFEGWFWFPPATDSCFGTLEIRRRDLRLRLRDSTGTVSSEFVVIHGEALGGDAVTLLDAYLTNRRDSSFGHNTEEYRVNSVLIGVHVKNADDLSFARARLHLRGLTEWLATPGVAANGRMRRGLAPHESDSKKAAFSRVIAWLRRRRRHTANDRGDDPRSLAVAIDDARLTLGFDRKRSIGVYSETTRDRGAATLELPAPLPLTKWLEKWTRPLTDLLVFATREQIVVESLVAVLEKNRAPHIHPAIRRALPDRAWNRVEVEVIRPQPVDVRPRGIDPFQHMLLPLGALRPHCQERIATFFQIHRALGGAAGFLFGTLNTRSIYEENRLTNLAAFAEGYHRTLHDEKPLTDAEHRCLVVSMLGAIAKRYRPYYQARLKYANSQSQRQRLRWLISRAEAVPSLADPKDTFCDQIVDTRNSYAHLGDHHPNALAPDDLHDAVERLIQVIEFNLLVDLGLDEAHAAKLLRLPASI